jgi:hypothetical protein
MGTDQTPGRAPGSCTLDGAGRQARAAEFDEFFATAVLGIDQPERTTIRLELRPDEQAGQAAGRLAAAETACCSFFTFTLAATAGRLVLEVTVPPGREDALDSMAARAAAGRLP